MPNTPNSVLVLDQFGRIPAPIGLTGITDGSNAAAGIVGEVISSLVLIGAAVPAASFAIINVTSIALTPGDWDVTGSVVTDPAASTVTQSLAGGLSLVSATRPVNLGEGFAVTQGVSTTSGNILSIAVSLRPFNVTANTTVFLIGQTDFTVSTMAVYGSLIARRMR